MEESTYQYKRNFRLIVSGADGTGLELSNLHCKFVTKRTNAQAINTADIRVYNLKTETEDYIRSKLAPIVAADGIISRVQGQVTIQGGYDANFGVVFQGNIKQMLQGRESATDTYIDLNCGDGDIAYSYAVVNKTIGGDEQPYFQSDLLNQMVAPMTLLGNVTLGPTQPVFGQKNPMPRGRTLLGPSRDKIRTFAKDNGFVWSIQNGEVQFVNQNGYRPGEAVIITSKTGMIGTPVQTPNGVNIVCLMNPRIIPGQIVKIDNRSIQGFKVDLSNDKDPVNFPPLLRADGVYTPLLVEVVGDNRGNDWYSKLTCLSIDQSDANLINSVSGVYKI